MLKKSLIIMAAVLLVFGGTVWALDGSRPENALTPENSFYDAGRAIENAQYALAADLEEKIMIQNEYSERRLAAMENAGNSEDFEELFDAYTEHEHETEELLEEIDGDGPDFDRIYDLVIESSEQRSVRLLEMSTDEDLPEGAREGAQRALENQEMAMEKLRDALDRAQEAYDKARSRADQDNGVTPPGPPEGIEPGPPEDKTFGPPEGAGQGRPDDVNPGPPGDINPGPPGNNDNPAGGSNPGGGGRP